MRGEREGGESEWGETGQREGECVEREGERERETDRNRDSNRERPHTHARAHK